MRRLIGEIPGHRVDVPEMGPGRASCSCGWRSDPQLSRHWSVKQAESHYDTARGLDGPVGMAPEEPEPD